MLQRTDEEKQSPTIAVSPLILLFQLACLYTFKDVLL